MAGRNHSGERDDRQARWHPTPHGEVGNDAESFSKNANATQRDGRLYHDELEQHVAELDQVRERGKSFSSLAGWRRRWQANPFKLETDMRRSEEARRSAVVWNKRGARRG
jgi:hypothetical protein